MAMTMLLRRMSFVHVTIKSASTADRSSKTDFSSHRILDVSENIAPASMPPKTAVKPNYLCNVRFPPIANNTMVGSEGLKTAFVGLEARRSIQLS